MPTFLIALAVVAAFVGLMLMSNATSGVGVIAFACFLLILARITQATEHHNAAMKAQKPPSA